MRFEDKALRSEGKTSRLEHQTLWLEDKALSLESKASNLKDKALRLKDKASGFANDASPNMHLDVIDELVDKCNNLLNNRLDKIMLMFRDSDPDFYNGYKRSRVIVDQ